jgi:hypothetical protein
MAAGLRALLEADELLYSGRYRAVILETFARRGIYPERRIDKEVGYACFPVRILADHAKPPYAPTFR